MRHIRLLAARRLLLYSLAGTCSLGTVGVQAAPFELVYTGAFRTDEALNVATASSSSYFARATPFTIHALFDDASPNLTSNVGGPFSGFRAYAPSSATIDIAGVRYGLDSILANPFAGVAVAIFDQNSFTPGFYGVGLIADPVNDGASIVGDFASASPNFTVAALTPTTFGDFRGAGHSSGACSSGVAPACPHLVTPWVLHDSSNVAYNLMLGNYSEDYPVAHTPGAMVGPLNTAKILAASTPPPTPVPKPSSYSLLLVGLLGLAWSCQRAADGLGGPR